jgi:uncharacterized protein YaiI (UPF0178 family)
MTAIYVDADACPVKDEVIRVAMRHNMMVHLVSNRWHRGHESPLVHKIVVGLGPDEADKWIAGQVSEDDIVVTADIPLAARCVEKKARVLDPRGKPFDEASIGMTLAMRDLMTGLREIGEITGGPAAFTPRDRSRFLGALENTIQSIGRGR